MTAKQVLNVALGTVRSLSLSPKAEFLLNSVLQNAANNISPKIMQTLTGVMKALNSFGLLDGIAKDLNKMSSLQALLVVSKSISEAKLLDLLGPIMKQASGNDEDEKDRDAREAAANRMIEFLESQVSVGHAIWAQSLQLDKEIEKFKEQKEKAKAQLKKQINLEHQENKEPQENKENEVYQAKQHSFKTVRVAKSPFSEKKNNLVSAH